MYNDEMQWNDWAVQAERYARPMIDRLIVGEELYQDWQNFRAGRTNAQIATAWNKTETQVAELDACIAAFHLLYGYANNGTPSQSDYLYSMRKFA